MSISSVNDYNGVGHCHEDEFITKWNFSLGILWEKIDNEFQD